MELGKIVEYIDRKKVVCAVVLDIKKNRLRLLTETNREVNMAESRLAHVGKALLDLSIGRDSLVSSLKTIAGHRKNLMDRIDIRELWEVLHSEQEWIDLMSMTEFCFPNHPMDDHQSAVVRAFFENRTYFKFNFDSFFPYTEEQVEQITARAREAERRNRIIEEGGIWLKYVLSAKKPDLPENKLPVVDVLKNYYLFGKECAESVLAKALLKRAGIESELAVFQILVKLGIWSPNENIELLRYEVPTCFSDNAARLADQLTENPPDFQADPRRTDLTGLELITIDGQSTLDFDDALSLHGSNEGYVLGVHIADVGEIIRRETPLDKEALCRASSIYMPDLKIPMLPPVLAEGLCSLKQGRMRPAVSVMITFSPRMDLIGFDIIPSIINVRHQLTYHDVDLSSDENPQIIILHKIARKFRRQRLAQGAVQISLPDINICFDGTGKPAVSMSDRESPGRMLVSEIMILSNWLTATFLRDRKIPAVFRSQPPPREKLFNGDEGTLFQNWMQRKLMSRFVLSSASGPHNGLGVDAYVTSTSPIRKYVDLVTQRQLRSALGLETPYSAEDIDHIIQSLEEPMTAVSRLQFSRHRYWLLKYLETRIGRKELAIVLNKRRNTYTVLLTNYMLECDLPLSGGISLKPEDLVQVVLQHVNARKDTISIFMG